MDAHARYRVYRDGRYARCVKPASPEERLCQNDGWEPVFDWSGDRFSAWTRAAVEFDLFPEDYDDRMMPIAVSEPVELFRSVCVAELEDILERGAVYGGGNSFNDFDRRRFVFFSPSLTDRCLAQGEELERAAAYAAVQKLDPSLEAAQARAAFLECYRPELAALRVRMESAPFSSAVLRTSPVTIALHYSHEHGRSGMGEEDEYGVFPGQVKAGDIVDVTLVKDGTLLDTVTLDDAAGLLSLRTCRL